MKLHVLAIAVIGSSTAAFADSGSVAAIKAGGLKRPDGTTLTGDGVEIGTVDVSRTGVRPNDTDAVTNGFVTPVESKINAGQSPGQDQFADAHAVHVAGIIIGKTGAPTSVAPNASLYSTSFGGSLNERQDLLSAQYIAKRFPFSNLQHIRVINHSWGGDPSDGPFEGNSQLTLGMDWIASQFDVLNVFAGPELFRGREPADNYNGITVAFLAEEPGGGYLRVASENDNDFEVDAAGDRVSVDLLAPGAGLTLATVGAGNPTTDVPFGTSFAAPHVTGTVALLNEFGDYQVTNSESSRWDSDNTRKHEVMKAVLLNSADKINGVHGSTRTILNENGQNWENTSAFTNDVVPLDQQMGAGALNAARALKQFRSGEYNNGEDIPSIGWDYGETGGVGTRLSYPFSSTVGGHVAITLAWDRKIDKFGGPDDTYTGSDIFSGNAVEDLDLFLLPVGWNDLFDDAVAKSTASFDSVEHIFKDVEAGDYEIVVNQFSGGDVDFGLAWWVGDPGPGDFDNDGDVDADDLSGPNGWEERFGADLAGSDFLNWQRNFVGAAAPLAPPGGGSTSGLGNGNSPGTPTGGGTQSSFGQTIAISVEGDSPEALMVGQTGQLTIMIDSDPAEVTFANGGLSLSIETSESGFIEITDADVNNPQIFGGYVDRWTHAEVVGLATDEIDELLAFSLGSPALTDADPANMESDGRFLFATIDYTVVGEMPAGGFQIDVAASERPDPAVSDGADVLGQIVFIPLSLSGSAAAAVPEPTSAMLAVISSVGLAIGRRRHGRESRNSGFFS